MLVVLVVEPDEPEREKLGERLHAAGFAVALCASVDQAPAELRPDAVVIPPSLSTGDRRGLIGRIGQVTEIVHEGDPSVVMRELTALVAHSRPIVQLSGVTVDLRTRAILSDGPTKTLTDREAALLAWLLARAGQVASRTELLVNVWGYRPSTVTRTVDTTMSRLREKIERDPSNPEHLLTVRGEGYRLVVPEAGPEGASLTGVFGRDDDLVRLQGELSPGRGGHAPGARGCRQDDAGPRLGCGGVRSGVGRSRSGGAG